MLLNRLASYGRAAARWEAIRDEIESRTGPFEVEAVVSREAVAASVRKAAGRGERVFVAAGGDGTVNAVLNALLALEDVSDACLGAVGLGSSNDFHKPFHPGAFIGDVPLRIESSGARLMDVIRIEFADAEGRSSTLFAAMNASLGITAESNANFNAPTRFARAARRFSVDAAIVLSILRTLATYRDLECSLSIDDSQIGSVLVSNLGVIKNPHFGGTLAYDTPIEPDDGKLGINLCENLSRLQALATVAALRRRRFRGRPKTRSWIGERVSVEADRTFALEADGEIAYARKAYFEVVPKRIRCCR
jgi:diacylglycerol kinase family enzyme